MTATNRDREAAAELLADVHSGWCGALRDHPSPGPCICRVQGIADGIAAALAAERARVLAPVLALAEELVFASDDLPPAVDAGSAAIRKDAREALADAAVRIRRAAQDGERA